MLVGKPEEKKALGRRKRRWEDNITRFGRYIVRSTLNFHRCSSRHMAGDDVNRATKGAIMISNATVVLKVIVAAVI
jgi:hypothetical protein